VTEPGGDAAGGAAGGLQRQLGLLDSTMINVGTMIGSGIFLVPSAIAAGLTAPGPVLLVWVVGGLVSLLGALAVAELAAAMPEAGGQYVYLRRAYGPAWGFLYGWACFAVINPGSIAAISVGFATYLTHFVPLDPLAVKLVAVGAIAALTGVNCLGVRHGATTQNVLTTLKIAALAALVLLPLAASAGNASAGSSVAFWPAGSFLGLLPALGVAMVAVLWTYEGWIEITYVGSEIRDPGRNLPRSIGLSLGLVTLLYVLVNAALLWVLSPGRMAASTLVASDAAQVVLGGAGATLVVAAILVSTLGANNGIVLTSARIPYAMARDGRFFAWAGRVHPTRHVPTNALVAQGLWTIALVFSGTYDQLATYVVFASFLFYALSAGAVLVLRRTEPALPRPYRAWGYPVTPLVFVAFALALVASTIVQAPRDAAIGAGLIAAGLPAYWWWTREARREARREAAREAAASPAGP